MKKSTLLALLCAWVAIAIGQQATWENFDVRFIPEGYSNSNSQLQRNLIKADNWQDFLSTHPGWSVKFTERTGMPHRALGKSFYVAGTDNTDRALNLLNSELAAYSIDPADLEFARIYEGSKYDFVDFYQNHEGIRVLGSRATFRFTPSGEVVMFGLDLYSDLEANTTPSIDESVAVFGAKSGIPYTMVNSTVHPELKILPVPQTGEEYGYDYFLVYEVDIELEKLNGVPGMFSALVDAHTGNLISRSHTVKECGHTAPIVADVDVEATVTNNPLQPQQAQALPYIRVNVAGTDYYTDVNGMLNIPTVTGPTSATVFMEGLYADARFSGSTASFTTMIDAGLNTITFDDPDAEEVEVAGYYHTSVVHDVAKSYWPAFTSLDYPLPVNVNESGDCNAFYDGSSINFFPASATCPATALFDDIIYHEYGHGLNRNLYSFFGGGVMDNGGLNEGYADVWGMIITDYPILGQGFNFTSTSEVRRYDIDPKVYPVDLVGQVHADGEIIAGAWWDYGQILGSTPMMADLWQATFPAVLDGPDGTEGEVYLDILIEALVQDDDDADLTNGTPNGGAITTAFAIHGITFLSGVIIDHELADIAVATADPISITAELDNLFFPDARGPFTLNWRTSPTAAYNQDLMTVVTGDSYNFDLPAQSEGTILDYYFTLEDTSGNLAQVLPIKAMLDDPNLPFYKLIGYSINYEEDFDTNFGDWITDPNGDDAATTGIWEVASPAGTVAQTSFDHTDDGFGGSNLCAVTGASGGGTGDNDIDGGKTSIQSTGFDASELDGPLLTYYRWFTNDPAGGANPGNDPFSVEISDDGISWVRVRQTYTSDLSWRRAVIEIEDYVTASATVYLRFTASDSLLPGSGLPFDGGSLVESAIDDVYLWGIGESTPPPPPNGIEDPEGNFTVEVYPNPTSGAFTVSFEGVNGNDVKIELINSAGQLVYTDAKGSINDGRIDIPELGLSAGMYSAKLEVDGKTFLRNVSVQ
ncbi:MAG: hypothetical protein ACI959_001183 [Limisphaerales bacterium]|jgi:hypothetical protein